jgi:nitrate/nitrite transporter NarK
LTLTGVIVSNAGILAALSIFWTVPPLLLQGTAAAVGIGLLSAAGNVGSMIAPAIIGYARDLSGSFYGAFIGLAFMSAIAGVLVLIVSRKALRGQELDLSKATNG